MSTLKAMFCGLVIVFVLFNLVGIVASTERKRWLIREVWRGFRPLKVLEALGMLVAVASTFLFLYRFIPVFGWGWWSLIIGRKGGGNIVVAPVMEGVESGIPAFQIGVICFFLMLILIMPFTAYAEEKIFRKGHNDKRSLIKQSVKFGLAHLLVGVPIAAGFALIIAGLFYHHKYLKSYRKFRNLDYREWEAEEKALIVSSTYHALANTLLLVILILVTSLLIFVDV